MKTKVPSPAIFATILFAGLVAALSVTLAQTGDDAVVHTVVTAIAKSSETADVPQQSVTVRLAGKPQLISGWAPLRGLRGGLELALLLDDSSRTSLGLHLNEIKNFLNGLPPNTEVAVGYMRNGSANLVQGFTADRNAAINSLRIPISTPGGNASPYFCLSDLVKHWPAPAADVRREVVMVTDGIDPYTGGHFDPLDPYVQAAISEAQRAGIIVYSIYFSGAGEMGKGFRAAEVGQNYLSQVSGGTGGQLYHLGFGNPVSFTPFFSDIQRQLENQYELSFVTQPKKNPQPITVKTSQPNIKLQAPTQLFARAAATGK